MHDLSFTSISLELKTNGTPISTATGFFYKYESRTYLISNWHVFSGRHAHTGQPLHTQGAIPDELSFSLHHKIRGDKRMFNYSIKLLNDNGDPIWLQHSNGQKYDIAAQLIAMPSDKTKGLMFDRNLASENLNESLLISIDSSQKSLNALIQPGMELIIIGYPKSISKQEGFPIWKRASIASEPELPADGLPIVLVDTATREGMSGAPVYQYFPGLVQGKDGSTTMYHGGLFFEFLGVYSRRYGAEDELSAQLGRVWKKSALDEMLRNSISGDFKI